MRYLIFLFLFLAQQGFTQDRTFLTERKIGANYVGGFYKGDFNNKAIFDVKQQVSPNIYVGNLKELLNALALAKRGDVIAIKDGAEIDLSTKRNIKISSGITLMGNRGVNGSKGPLLYTNNLKTSPLFVTAGNDINIIGIRFRGPDGLAINKGEIEKFTSVRKAKGVKINTSRIKTYAIPNSIGIKILHKNVVVMNCEIDSWSHAAVFVGESGAARIEFNYIHHNQRSGLGYGVLVDGESIIKGNLFNFNRHAIASSGIPTATYVAEYNYCATNSSNQGHIFDVHGGKDRKDGTQLAGRSFIIRNNLFEYNGYPLFKIRGKSSKFTEVTNNYIKNVSRSSDPNSSLYFQQINDRGNFKVTNNSFLK